MRSAITALLMAGVVTCLGFVAVALQAPATNPRDLHFDSTALAELGVTRKIDEEYDSRRYGHYSATQLVINRPGFPSLSVTVEREDFGNRLTSLRKYLLHSPRWNPFTPDYPGRNPSLGVHNEHQSVLVGYACLKICNQYYYWRRVGRGVVSVDISTSEFSMTPNEALRIVRGIESALGIGVDSG